MSLKSEKFQKMKCKTAFRQIDESGLENAICGISLFLVKSATWKIDKYLHFGYFGESCGKSRVCSNCNWVYARLRFVEMQYFLGTSEFAFHLLEVSDWESVIRGK